MNDRQLDVWWMYKDPEAVLSPLKIILGHKDEITKEDPLYLFVNCSSKFIVDGKEIERYGDTLLRARQADINLGLSSARYYDEELGSISATPEDIMRFLDKHEIPYKLITGMAPKETTDNPNIPETWLIRDKGVLIESLTDSKNHGCNECVIYPNIKSSFSMGYYLRDGSYCEVWGLNFKGVIETNNSLTFLINENDKRNVTIEEACKTIEEMGMSYTIGSNLEIPSNITK